MPDAEHKFTHCHSSGALVPDTEGPVHKYLATPPGCWGIYGEVLAREYSDYRYMSVHQITVDAYAVQQSGQMPWLNSASECSRT